MIRIDELYNNTFWPWMQENKPDTRMFFCDPPGSVALDDLINYGRYYPEFVNVKGQWTKDYCSIEKDYIFIHDQEPVFIDIHKQLFEKVIYKNRDLSPSPQGHIITSEKNSTFVDHITNEYGWKPHYYFFHGWAAMDWYRGYHRSFLISRAKVRSPTKAFISPNRIIGGKRDHRVLFLYHIFKNKLNDNYITSPKICPEENVHITEIAKKYINVYPDIIDTFNNTQLPQTFENEKTQLMTSCWITNFNESADSLFYVPTETVYFGKRWHLTEKSFKPIVLEMPFILVAPMGSLEYLRSYGFKTFNNIIDESYDEETDDILRLEKISRLLKDINDLSIKERQQIHKHCLPIVEHNYNHFYFGDFESILWKELTGMMQEWL